MKSILFQYLLGVGLALLLMPIINGIEKILPDIGYGFLDIFYLLIFLFLTIFYFLATNFNSWTAEQVALENRFHNTFIYQGNSLIVLVLGGLLWVTNKIAIDQLLKLQKKSSFKTNKLDRLIYALSSLIYKPNK